MSKRRARFLISLLVLMIGVVGATACGGSDEPELPDTTAAPVLPYLEEVDYRESWELWLGSGREVPGRRPARYSPDHLSQPCRL